MSGLCQSHGLLPQRKTSTIIKLNYALNVKRGIYDPQGYELLFGRNGLYDNTCNYGEVFMTEIERMLLQIWVIGALVMIGLVVGADLVCRVFLGYGIF